MQRLKKERSARAVEVPLALLDREGLRGAAADGDIESRLALAVVARDAEGEEIGREPIAYPLPDGSPEAPPPGR